MNKSLIKYLFAFMLLSAFLMTSCGDDENTTDNDSKYDLEERSDSGVSGDVEFLELTDGRVQIEISLDDTENGDTHPAHIHANSAALGGDILISLTPVAGSTGSSVTIVDKFDNGDAFTFDMLANLDAYINVHLSADELETVIAQGDIGSNELTGKEKSYDLDERAVDGISGTVTFKERKNGFVLAEIDLDGTPDNGSHPAHIHANSAAEGGDILVTFTPVDGSTGKSVTSIRTLDDGTAMNYQLLKLYDGYVNVHMSANDLGTIVAQGNIGINN